MSEQTLAPRRRLTWWQLVFPVLVLIVLFGVVLPMYIDYEDVWQEITALDGASLLLPTLLGIISSWSEAAIYTSLIPGLSYRIGWKAFLGGNTVAFAIPLDNAFNPISRDAVSVQRGRYHHPCRLASELFAVYAIEIMMSLMPVVPAGLGEVELTYVWLLAPDDPQLADQIAAATFTHRIFFWLLPIVIGIFPLVD